jgi:hypothetical protein
MQLSFILHPWGCENSPYCKNWGHMLWGPCQEMSPGETFSTGGLVLLVSRGDMLPRICLQRRHSSCIRTREVHSTTFFPLWCSVASCLYHTFLEGVIADQTSLATTCTSSAARCTTPGAFTSVSAVKSSLLLCESAFSSASCLHKRKKDPRENFVQLALSENHATTLKLKSR